MNSAESGITIRATPLKFLSTSVLLALSACGGGGSPSGGTSGSDYVTWTGSANGTTVLDAANNKFAVDGASRAVVDTTTSTSLGGLSVTASAQVMSNGVLIGTVNSAPGSNGAQIAEFFCSNGSPMTISVNSTWTYSCPSASNAVRSGSGGGSVGSSDSTPGSTSGGGSGSGSSISYASWSGSTNGTTVKDASNNDFAVDNSSRAVIALGGNLSLTGLTVSSQGQMISGGRQIGTVSLASATNGSKIAEFVCADGSGMTLSLTSSSWTYSCADNSGGSTGNSGNAGNSSSGGSGGSGGSGSSTNDPCGTYYTNWSDAGNENGCVLLDGANQQFGSGSNSGALYAYGTTTPLNIKLVAGYNNGFSYVLASGSTLGYVSLNGQIYGSLSLKPGTTGGSVAVFTCLSGPTMTIFTAGGGNIGGC